MRIVRSLLALSLLAVSALTPSIGLAAQDPGDPPVTAAGAEPTARLREVRAMESGLKGLTGAARQELLERIATSYESIAGEAGSDAKTAPAAWFDAGEAWRRHRSLAKAEACFAKALELDEGRLRARCWYQLGEMQRRQKKVDEALASYRECAAIDHTTERGHRARLWIARLLLAGEKPEDGIAAYRSALESTEHPRRVVELCNDLAKALIQRGDLDGAAAAIAHAEEVARPEIEAGAKGSVGLAKALDQMSAKRALQRARDKSGGALRDAIDVERSTAVKR